jgi:hypothetical protein
MPGTYFDKAVLELHSEKCSKVQFSQGDLIMLTLQTADGKGGVVGNLKLEGTMPSDQSQAFTHSAQSLSTNHRPSLNHHNPYRPITGLYSLSTILIGQSQAFTHSPQSTSANHRPSLTRHNPHRPVAGLHTRATILLVRSQAFTHSPRSLSANHKPLLTLQNPS